MTDAHQKGPWRILSEQALQYSIVTHEIAEWLNSFSIPQDDDDDPDFSDLAEMIEKRGEIVAVLRELDPSAFDEEDLNDDEAMCKGLSLDLLGRIDDEEQENEARMQRFAAKYREKLKSIKQAREAMTAYNQTQAYSAPVDALGHNFNQAN